MTSGHLGNYTSLTDVTEFELVKSHAKAGFDLLKRLTWPWPLAEVANQHHERLDGSGYPNGLKGDEIILWSALKNG